MCMAAVWLKSDEREEEILTDVAGIEVEGSNIMLSALFGENKCLKAKIKEIDFLNSKVWLTQINTTKEK